MKRRYAMLSTQNELAPPPTHDGVAPYALFCNSQMCRMAKTIQSTIFFQQMNSENTLSQTQL